MKARLVYSNDDGFSLGVELLRAVVEQQVPVSEVDHEVWFHEPWGNLTEDYLGHYNPFLARLYAQRPDVLAFSAFVWNHDEFVRMGRLTKLHLPDCLIVWGGGQTDSRRVAQRLLTEYRWLDLVVRGEAEDSYPALLRALAAGDDLGAIAGLSWRRGEQIVHNPDAPEVNLTLLPQVFTRERLDLGPIFARYPRAVLSYETGRGCRQKCGFCLYSSSKLRVFSMERVERELGYLLEQRIPALRVCDAHLGVSRPRAMEIFEIIAAHNRGTVVDVYPDSKHVDVDYVRAMNRANCRVISLGIQSSDASTLRLASRRFDEERFAQTAQLIRRHHNHRLAADIIIGMPGDNYEKVRESVRFAYRSGIERVHFAPLMAFPGTEFYERAEEYELEFCDFAPPLVVRSHGFPTAEYGQAMVMARQVEALQDTAPTLVRCLVALEGADPVAFAESVDPAECFGPRIDAAVLRARIRDEFPPEEARFLAAGLAWDQNAAEQHRAAPLAVPAVTDDLAVASVRDESVQVLDFPIHRLITDFTLRHRDLAPGRYAYLRPAGGLAVYELSGPLRIAYDAVVPGMTVRQWRERTEAGGVSAAAAAEALRILCRCGVVALTAGQPALSPN